MVGEGGKLPPPPFPPSPTAKEGPTPYKGWALQQGGHTPVSPQLKTNYPLSYIPPFICGNRNDPGLGQCLEWSNMPYKRDIVVSLKCF